MFGGNWLLTVGSGARVYVNERDPFCADRAKFALPLSVVSGARVFVTECDQ